MKDFFSACMLFLAGIVTLSSCGSEKENKAAYYDSLALDYTVINTLPHNGDAFIQGLVVYDNKILESTGQHGTSWIAEVNPSSGEHNKKVVLEERYFGEGITVLNNKIYQLTWQEKIGFIYDARTYKKIGDWKYTTQGWGITHNDSHLIMSDGSDKLYFLDTVSLKPVKTIRVLDYKAPVKELNELEYVDGYIFANVWGTDTIIKIDPNSGMVVGKLNLSALTRQAKSASPAADVLNGIAYDKNSKSFLVTGKLWTKTFLIRIDKKQPTPQQ